VEIETAFGQCLGHLSLARFKLQQMRQSKTGVKTPHSTPAAISKDDTYNIILQSETRPISQEQLVADVKGVFAGFVMVEALCERRQ
jgi:hypothetical protein